MKKIVLGLAIAAMTFVGCKNGEKTETSSEETTETVDQAIVDSHNSENSLDWAGVYEGTTPCADCSGIETILELKNDKTFKLSQTYLGKTEDDNLFTQEGNFIWNQDGTEIRLKIVSGSFQFKVGENQVWMLDEKGNVIEGDLANMYILKKTIQ
ncbi:putative lipoprotein NlpE involved in copper resistance [Aequorivita sublithincola DSM 14238]|uniref:Putative lipoprotein NlpE involved in copper resistance n=1 Tax=Aequorivita sublithincola (strain DSM 14238 / LMG 21431 / ACAM 643 / 9-3) TaxID=746697 RepID=I3YVS1_AEQSU|nr:copper resistance protein NlpE [Aequorivita sublithincola]AFL81089.1 putative lipoprotein NlpE involved in copper resistance [Aequorivita sublithincola DSM 14238]